MTRDELFKKAMDAYDAAGGVEEGVNAVIDLVSEVIQSEGQPVSDDPLTRRLNGTGPNPVRSFRVPDEIWDMAKARAAAEGVSISHVIVLLLVGYAEEFLDLSEIRERYEAKVRSSDAELVQTS